MARLVRYGEIVEAAGGNTRRLAKECLNDVTEVRCDDAFEADWWKNHEQFKGS